jgi:hypothetical protein
VTVADQARGFTVYAFSPCLMMSYRRRLSERHRRMERKYAESLPRLQNDLDRAQLAETNL